MMLLQTFVVLSGRPARTPTSTHPRHPYASDLEKQSRQHPRVHGIPTEEVMAKARKLSGL